MTKQKHPTAAELADKAPPRSLETDSPSAERRDLSDEIIEQNVVDEASWESFPASDPPAFNPGKATKSDWPTLS